MTFCQPQHSTDKHRLLAWLLGRRGCLREASAIPDHSDTTKEHYAVCMHMSFGDKTQRATGGRLVRAERSSTVPAPKNPQSWASWCPWRLAAQLNASNTDGSRGTSWIAAAEAVSGAKTAQQESNGRNCTTVRPNIMMLPRKALARCRKAKLRDKKTGLQFRCYGRATTCTFKRKSPKLNRLAESSAFLPRKRTKQHCGKSAEHDEQGARDLQ